MNYLLITLILLLQYNFNEGDEKKINFIISIENISESPYILLDDFSFEYNINICFISIETGNKFKIGEEAVKYDYSSKFVIKYIAFQPKESLELKIAPSEENMKNFNLPKGKYKVRVSYASSKGKDCLHGYFISSEVIAEKE